MELRDTQDRLSRLEPTSGAPGAFGQPYETRDGATVIPVSKPRGEALGVVVIHGGKTKWVPTVDSTRIALAGLLIGLVSAAFAGLAMVRRPPWPDIRGNITREC